MQRIICSRRFPISRGYENDLQPPNSVADLETASGRAREWTLLFAVLIAALGLPLIVGATPALDALRLGAQPMELETMVDHLEPTKFLSDLLLTSFDLVIFEFENQPTLGTDEVIVVVPQDLVARLPIAKLTRLGKS